MNSFFREYKTILWQICFAWFFILMLNITLKYVSFDSDAAFLQIKQTEVNTISPYLFIFYVHVCSAIFTLFAGFTQFNDRILKRKTRIHKNVGKLYVLVVLLLAAPSGFFIGLFANGGFYAKVSFVTLSILWFYFTLKAFLEIKKRQINKHKAFMLRSFALAFSAITLRLWKVILVYLFHPSPMDVYQIIAWLGWIPNLLLIEYFIYKQKIK
ncbi:DUF2306 domain-containing protein [Flavobacterium wongokense]|uniref:DUF2306 domain-containing protein n=1 Tax=Flavobacterium wongokense TaxID=2910674 RepID=UPI001F3A07D3|nr:DUF2306 domain-containing protein [Flavobacterium sp. WG47]MCF6132043.1 DUF2306 domain-containing protein [Flavobacterium sp. WG47]